MSTLSVGIGQQFSTIADAVNASQNGDTINIQAGTYLNDFSHITHDLTLNAVGGAVVLDATQSPPDGKAIITEGGAGVTVNINGLTFEGAAVSDANGAGIRYEGGTLNISNSSFHDNQNGLLGAADANGKITIDHSDFGFNGVGGDGHTHDIYVGQINEFDITNSYVHDANVGHEIKSRAANNTITGNVVADNNSSASYTIDLPNGGNATIANNLIQQGPNSQNPNVMAIGEEGASNPTGTIWINGNTIINDEGRGPALWNATGTTANFASNAVYGFSDNNALVNGLSNQSGTSVLLSRPSFAQAVPGATSPATTQPVATPVLAQTAPPATITASVTTVASPVTTTPASTASTGSGLVINVSEDAWQGDAQFTVSVDGQPQGGLHTATASHAAGQSQAVSIGALSAGPHQIGVSFVNDAWGGTASTDRNLYVDGATLNGKAVPGAPQWLFSNGTDFFTAGGSTSTSSATTPVAQTTTPATVASTSASTSASGGALVVNVSEDAWQGDAQFVATVDGQQVGGVRTATALHGQGNQAVSLGDVTPGQHQVGITFLNDAWGGTASTDRNLYVDGATINGQAIPNASAPLFSAGTDTFGFSAAAISSQTTSAAATTANGVSSNAVLNVSEDAWLGDAQFTIAIDGKQQGGIYTATASHAAGQSQAISIAGIAESFQSHDIAVTFVNDAYGGTPTTDRNLYVNSVQFDNQTVPGGSLTMFSGGTQHVSALAPANWTGN